MTSLHAEQVRAQKMADAHAVGNNDALIARLVEAFYTTIRKDDLLGPIFAAHVSQWPPHLARLEDFWASITMDSGRFHGNPMAKHIAIGTLQQAHFDRWLMLWNKTIAKIVPNEAAADIFRAAAARIARSLFAGIELKRGGLDAIMATRDKAAQNKAQTHG